MALYLGSNKIQANGGIPVHTPIVDIYDSDLLTAALTSDNVGMVYRYIGETNETYINGDLYEVIEV